MTQFGSAGGATTSYGDASPIVRGPLPVSARGATFSSGTATASSLYPQGAIADFGIWDIGQPDAAQSRFGLDYEANSSVGNWKRYFISGTAPSAYYSGNGQGPAMWPVGTRAVLKISTASMPNGEKQNLDAIQFEPANTQKYAATSLANSMLATDTTATITVFPQWASAVNYLVIEPGTTNAEIVSLTGYGASAVNLNIVRGMWGTIAVAHPAGAQVILASTPQNYEDARKIKLYPRADRVNYSLSPTFTTINPGQGGCTTSSDSSIYKYGTNSEKIITATTGGDQWGYSNLYLGQNTPYTWSVWVYATADTYIDASNWYLQEAQGAFRKIALAGNGLQTIYGGQWTRVWGTGTTAADWNWASRVVFRPPRNFINTQYLTNTPLWLSGMLVEKGSYLRDYFDGSFTGPDYIWEGIAFQSRSHYYSQFVAKNYRLDALVSDNLPLGAPHQIFYATKPAETPY